MTSKCYDHISYHRSTHITLRKNHKTHAATRLNKGIISLSLSACADPVNSARGVWILTGLIWFAIFHRRDVRTSLRKQLDPRGPIASQLGSIPDPLRKPIATCDFPERGPDPAVPHSGSDHALTKNNNTKPGPNTSFIHNGRNHKR